MLNTKMLKRIKLRLSLHLWVRAVAPAVGLLLPAAIACLAFGLLYITFGADGSIMPFAAGVAFGAACALAGVILGLGYLSEIERHRHDQAMQDFDEERRLYEQMRKARNASTVWVVSDDEASQE